MRKAALRSHGDPCNSLSGYMNIISRFAWSNPLQRYLQSKSQSQVRIH